MYGDEESWLDFMFNNLLFSPNLLFHFKIIIIIIIILSLSLSLLQIDSASFFRILLSSLRNFKDQMAKGSFSPSNLGSFNEALGGEMDTESLSLSKLRSAKCQIANNAKLYRLRK